MQTPGPLSRGPAPWIRTAEIQRLHQSVFPLVKDSSETKGQSKTDAESGQLCRHKFINGSIPSSATEDPTRL